MAEVFAGVVADFDDGARKIVPVNGREVVVLRHDDSYYAYANYCLHNGGPVGEGVLIGRVEAILGENQTSAGERFSTEETHLVCPWHGWEYNLKTGACAGDPSRKLRRFETVEREGNIYVVA
ncbi:MAG: Rieske (2Fe-2S) protein [Chloroflexi bacterium]|nr:Rieske (2Fe-2S) protein [Chloroflexota bacterium]